MSRVLIFLVVSCWFSVLTGQEAKAVHDVYDYGAIGDGVTNDRDAIQRAIDACVDGGRVVLRNGTFLSGQIELVSNLVLEIDSTATLLGVQSDAEADYPHGLIETEYPNRMLEDCQRRLIYGNHVRNVTLTGGGTINGQGTYDPWMNVQNLGTEKDRPSLLTFVGATNIVVENLTLLYPACWTQVYIESDSLILRNLTVNTGELTPNRDGIDIVDCHHVLIEDCSIQSEDDGICFKSGSEYGCQDVVVRRCTMDKLNVIPGNCIKLGTDGLGSFTGFEFYDLTLINAFAQTAIVLESMDGAVIDDIDIHDCEIRNCGQAIFVLLADRGRTVPGRQPRIGSISNVSFRNIRGDDFTQQFPSIITGIPGHNLQNITLENVNLRVRGGIRSGDQAVMEYDGTYPEGNKFGNTGAHGYFVRHADQVDFIDCEITTEEPDARPWLDTDDVGQINIR
ncbi:MAG: glycosyl hydrolase family 28 protein [Lewinella sp.]